MNLRRDILTIGRKRLYIDKTALGIGLLTAAVAALAFSVSGYSMMGKIIWPIGLGFLNVAVCATGNFIASRIGR